MSSRMFRRLFSVFLFGVACVATPVFAQTTPTSTTTTARSIPLSMPINGQTSVTGLPEYITLVFRYMLGVASILATIMIVYGGFLYLLGATTGSTMSGKAKIQDAITGLVLLFLAYALLFTISPNLVRLQVRGLTNIQQLSIQGQVAPTSQQVALRTVDTFEVPRATACNDQLCQDEARRLQRTGTYICDPLAATRPGVSCEGTNCRVICARQAEGLGPQINPTAPLQRCALDADCGRGACMRTNVRRTDEGSLGAIVWDEDIRSKPGMCSDGREGSRCRCVGRGCFQNDNNDRGYITNNRFVGTVVCQQGLTCVLEGADWYCRRAPNQAVSAPTVYAPGSRQVNQTCNETVDCVRGMTCEGEPQSKTCRLPAFDS